VRLTDRRLTTEEWSAWLAEVAWVGQPNLVK